MMLLSSLAFLGLLWLASLISGASNAALHYVRFKSWPMSAEQLELLALRLRLREVEEALVKTQNSNDQITETLLKRVLREN